MKEIRNKLICIGVLMILFLTPACAAEKTSVRFNNASQTGTTTAVPSLYSRPAKNQGKVERLDYASKDYARDSKAITKTAYVYLPYGYDPNGQARYKSQATLAYRVSATRKLASISLLDNMIWG